MRLFHFFLSGLLICTQTPAQGVSGAGKPAEPQASDTAHTVSITFTATDSQGNPLRDLSVPAVLVSDNNHMAQTLEVRDASDLPLHLGIVLLASKQKFEQQQAAAVALAQKVLRPGKDQAFVITAGGGNPWPNPRLNWIKDPSAVAQAIRALDKDTGLPDLFNFQLSTDQVGLGRATTQRYELGGGFSFFDVIWAMMKADPRPARRAVLIFRLASAHAPGYGRIANEAVEQNHERVIRAAQVLGVSFYAIGVDDPSTAAADARDKISTDYASIHPGESRIRTYDQNMIHSRELQYTAGRQNVDRLADDTGGRAWWTVKKNYEDAVPGIANELAGKYMVTFAPSSAMSPGSMRSLKVQVTGAVRVSAPHAYLTRAQ